MKKILLCLIICIYPFINCVAANNIHKFPALNLPKDTSGSFVVNGSNFINHCDGPSFYLAMEPPFSVTNFSYSGNIPDCTNKIWVIPEYASDPVHLQITGSQNSFHITCSGGNVPGKVPGCNGYSNTYTYNGPSSTDWPTNACNFTPSSSTISYVGSSTVHYQCYNNCQHNGQNSCVFFSCNGHATFNSCLPISITPDLGNCSTQGLTLQTLDGSWSYSGPFDTPIVIPTDDKTDLSKLAGKTLIYQCPDGNCQGQVVIPAAGFQSTPLNLTASCSLSSPKVFVLDPYFVNSLPGIDFTKSPFNQVDIVDADNNVISTTTLDSNYEAKINSYFLGKNYFLQYHCNINGVQACKATPVSIDNEKPMSYITATSINIPGLAMQPNVTILAPDLFKMEDFAAVVSIDGQQVIFPWSGDSLSNASLEIPLMYQTAKALVNPICNTDGYCLKSDNWVPLDSNSKFSGIKITNNENQDTISSQNIFGIYTDSHCKNPLVEKNNSSGTLVDNMVATETNILTYTGYYDSAHSVAGPCNVGSTLTDIILSGANYEPIEIKVPDSMKENCPYPGLEYPIGGNEFRRISVNPTGSVVVPSAVPGEEVFFTCVEAVEKCRVEDPRSNVCPRYGDCTLPLTPATIFSLYNEEPTFGSCPPPGKISNSFPGGSFRL